MVPPGRAPSPSPRPPGSAAFPLVGAVVVLVGAVGAVPGAGLVPVVEVVICPRRYLPSSVPPQPATNSPQTAITVARFALDRPLMDWANSTPPNPTFGNVAAYASEWSSGPCG